jgi:hypothetical protein
MKTYRLFLLLLLFCLPFASTAQVQWYQNQDGNSPPPGGTFGSCAKAFTNHSFVACYQWGSDNEQYTWKITKSHINGAEQRNFFVSGTWANVEMRVNDNSLYVLVRSFPLDGTTSFTVYKLDSNLVVKKQKQISFPNNFLIYNINAFVLDNSGSVYMTGDGQYPSGPDINPASFVVKTDRNLNIKWYRMDSTATSYTQVQVDKNGKVFVIEDYYTFFPEVRIKKFSSAGNLLNSQSLLTDPGRFNLIAKLDESGNMFLYGGQTVGDTAQAMYLYKLSRQNGNVIYLKTYFRTMGIQLQDFVTDNDGKIFALVSKYEASGEQKSVVARINPQSGNIFWTKEYAFSADSTVLTKLVVNNNSNRFYAVGARRNINYLSKGMALRFNKNGQPDAGFNGPDSTNAQRSHSLIDGLIDRNDELITIGNTNDFDPYTYNSSYFRAFAVSFGQRNGHHGCDDKGTDPGTTSLTARGGEAATEEPASSLPPAKLVLYPNPVVNELLVSNIDRGVYEEIGIYSMQGELLLRQYITGTNSRFNVRSLAGGSYLLVLRAASVAVKNKTIPFVVQK